ncbi:rhodanese-like domain-containing protein [Pseudonocardia sp. N23]|uniref:rhodanese-like domain-containing protein n=1 Tax=Pseudonocardia sp. N23 TaxID=1987376 RepID=UPI000BFBC8F4|nr:rhodanese-like domain-containing protein [Pseudonocardia sp. N23]GAY10964.1 rhodanese-related sulfurtransferase [Pseudonocardia sp. N23]
MTSSDQISQIDPAAAETLTGAGALLLDVREPDEWTAGHIPGAVHMPLGSLDLAAIPRDRVVVAVCRSGKRSGKAAAALAQAGFDVRNLALGMKAWAADGRTVARDDGTPGSVA